MKRLLAVACASVAMAGCANPSGMLDPEGYCRRKTENWTIAWSMVGQPTQSVIDVYGKPVDSRRREGGYTELMYWKRGSDYHLDNATHFIVDGDGRVVSWHDPEWVLKSEEACERWRRESCPMAPACGRDPS
jgi:hypothetical protein